MTAAIILYPDEAPDCFLDDARQARSIARTLQDCGLRTTIVVVTAQEPNEPTFPLVESMMVAEGIACEVMGGNGSPRSLAGGVGLRLQTLGAKLVLFFDCPALAGGRRLPLLFGQPRDILRVVLVRRPLRWRLDVGEARATPADAALLDLEQEGLHGADKRIYLSQPLASWCNETFGLGEEEPCVLPLAIPGLDYFRRLARNLADPEAGGGSAQRLLVLGGLFRLEDLRLALEGTELALAEGLSLESVQLLGLPQGRGDTETLAVVAASTSRWPLPVRFAVPSSTEEIVRAAAHPATLVVLPDRYSLWSRELGLCIDLGLSALVPDLPALCAQLPPSSSIRRFEPSAAGLAQALASPPGPTLARAPEADDRDRLWRETLKHLVARAPELRQPSWPAWQPEEEELGIVVVSRSPAEPLDLCLLSYRLQRRRLRPAIVVLDAGAGLAPEEVALADAVHRVEEEDVLSKAASLAREAGWRGLLLCAADTLAVPELVDRYEQAMSAGALAACFVRGQPLPDKEIPRWVEALQEASRAQAPRRPHQQRPFANGFWRTEALTAVVHVPGAQEATKLRQLESALTACGLPNLRIRGIGFGFPRRALADAPASPRAASGRANESGQNGLPRQMTPRRAAAYVSWHLDKAAARLDGTATSLLASLTESSLALSPKSSEWLETATTRLFTQGATAASIRTLQEALFAEPFEEGASERSRQLLAKLVNALAYDYQSEASLRLRQGLTPADIHGAFANLPVRRPPPQAPSQGQRRPPSAEATQAPAYRARGTASPVTGLVIGHTGHSGADYLLSALATHPELLMLEQKIDYSATGAVQAAQLSAQLEEVAQDLAGGRKAVLQLRLDKARCGDRLSEILGRHNLRLMALHRTNFAKQTVCAINQQRFYDATGRWQATEPVSLLPMLLDPARFRTELTRVQERRRKAISLLETAPPDFILVYEQLLIDWQGSIRKILERLGVTKRPLHSRVCKITPNNLRRVIANLDQLAAGCEGAVVRGLLLQGADPVEPKAEHREPR